MSHHQTSTRSATAAAVLATMLAAVGCEAGAPSEHVSSTTGLETSGPFGNTDGPETSSAAGSGTASTAHGASADSTGVTSHLGTDSGDDGDSGGDTSACDDAKNPFNPAAGELGHSQIAHWKYGRSAVLTINFDDSTPGQAQIGVPAMVERGLVGTWFVNPGVLAYQDNEATWTEIAPSSFQELANHTMDHAGAANYAEAEFQVGEAAAIIRSAYPSDRSPLMAFNNGGGTTWNISDAEYQELLAEHHQVERVHSSGIAPATPGADMFTDLKAYMQAQTPADDWARIHFHGICSPNDTVNCVCDTPGQSSNCREFRVSQVNNGAVRSTDFLYFLDQVSSDAYFSEEVWVAGFASAHKYQQARPVSQGVVLTADDTGIELCLVSELDGGLYDEALTVMTEVPAQWNGCTATQEGQSMTCRMSGATAHFEARIDRGPITLAPS